MSLPIFVAYHFACLVYVLHSCCICTMLNEGPLLSDVASCQTRRWSSVMFVHTHVALLSLFSVRGMWIWWHSHVVMLRVVFPAMFALAVPTSGWKFVCGSARECSLS